MALTADEQSLLDEVQIKVNQFLLSDALVTLYSGIKAIHNGSTAEHWKQFIPEYRKHPVNSFFYKIHLSAEHLKNLVAMLVMP